MTMDREQQHQPAGSAESIPGAYYLPMLTTISLLALTAASPVTSDTTPTKPIVIAHRGASGHRPEHTLEAYRLAIEMGADFIEPDLVSTKDGVLVARHENEIGSTTDVASRPELAARRATKTIDGKPVTGWFTEDFTLAELKTLRARERLPHLRSTEHDGLHQVPTLDEVIALAREESAARGREIGIYPETKHPSYFDSIGLALEPPLLAALEAAGWRDRSAPVFVQSFETANLRRLRGMTGVRLIQLIEDEPGLRPYDFVRSGDARTYADLVTPAGLAEIATYADGIGPARSWIIPRALDGRLAAPTALVRDAHAAGLLVHPWTFRAENFFLPLDFRRGDRAAPEFARRHGDAAAELAAFLAAGVDGVFTDFPDVAARALGRP